MFGLVGIEIEGRCLDYKPVRFFTEDIAMRKT